MIYPASAHTRLSVVIPCFNEETVLTELYQRMTAVCHNVVATDYEIVLINDGSQDNTWQMICDTVAGDHRVVGVNLSRNYGHQAALTAGLSMARGQRILIIDADLQDPPELLADMMTLMDQGADVVYGQRIERKGEGWFKKFSATLFYRLLKKIAGIDIPVDTGDFRLINRRVLEALQTMPEHYRFIRGMVAWIGFKQVPIQYTRQPRFAGTTKYSLYKMLSFSLDAITGFSILPLRLNFYLGILLLLISVLLIIYSIYSWLFLAVVTGWTSLLMVITLFGALNSISLGIIGEYVGRTFMQTKHRPIFLISEIVSNQEVTHEPRQ